MEFLSKVCIVVQGIQEEESLLLQLRQSRNTNTIHFSLSKTEFIGGAGKL